MLKRKEGMPKKGTRAELLASDDKKYVRRYISIVKVKSVVKIWIY